MEARAARHLVGRDDDAAAGRDVVEPPALAVKGATRDLAVFEHSTWRGGGTLRVVGGRSIRVTTNLWQSKIEFQLAEDRVLFRYLPDGFLRQQSDLQVLPPLQAMPESPWLLLFGWYLVVMMHQDNATHVAIVASPQHLTACAGSLQHCARDCGPLPSL